MKKYKEWLTNEIEIMESETSENYPHEQMVEREVVLNLIDQLDEPEKVIIPQFVADWIAKHRDTFDLYPALKRLEGNPFGWKQIYTWYRTNTHDFVNAYLTEEYEVEEEQKYYVMNNDNRMMLGRMMDGKTITEADPFKLEDLYEGEKKSHRLTEQEIKDYDERYWLFAKNVEELEK